MEDKKEGYKIFFSRSLDEKINPFTKGIKVFLRDTFKFRYMCTVGLTYVEDESMLKSIIKEIEKSDIVICCFTKDIKREDNKFISKPSVYMEYSIAKAFGKPVISFVEKGTEINSMVNASTQYITISRNEIKKIKDGSEVAENIRLKIKSAFEKSIEKKVLDYFVEEH